MKELLHYAAGLLTPGNDPNTQVTNLPTGSPDVMLQNGLNIAYLVAGIIAVIVIIVGGIMYTVSHGESATITKAKNLILYAIVGLVVVISAFAITNFIIWRIK